MTPSRRATFPHIVRLPGVVGGDPVVKGTRIPIRCIVEYFRAYGSLDESGAVYPTLSRSTIEGAVAYYQAHREEVDRTIEENRNVENEEP